MITKLVVYGTDRMDAIGKMKAALSGVRIKGVDTNIALQEKLLSMPEFLSGTHDIHSLERLMPDLSGDRPKATAGNAISR